MQKIKLINQTNGVLVLANMYNHGHVNLSPKGSKEFTEQEYYFYKKMAEARIRNGLLKLEYVNYPDAEPVKIEEPITPEPAQAEVVEDDKPEFDDAGYEEAEAQLAGLEEEIPKDEPVISKKKKKKMKNKKV